MNSIQTMHNSAVPSAATSPQVQGTEAAMSSFLILLLAVCTGLAVASLYYSQPMLELMGRSVGAGDDQIGLVPTLTQLGYALGILFLAPLGDRHDRRSIIIIKAVVLTGALLLTGFAHRLDVLLAASLAIGIAATLAQDIVPAAAMLAPADQRGKVVGTVMTGLLLGILLSRVISGIVADQWGWRAMFVAAAGGIALLGVAAWRFIPHIKAGTDLPYLSLLASLATLWRTHRELRRAALAQGLLAVGFSAFWSTLAILLHREPFHLGSAVAGTFGLAGAAGALDAPLAGHLSDRRGPELVTRVGAALTAIAFLAMSAYSWFSPTQQLWLLGFGAVLFDMGVQVTLIAHQTLIYKIDQNARSRLNAVLFVGMFTGMASGAFAGSQLLAHFGWIAVTGLASLSSLAALAVRLRAPA